VEGLEVSLSALLDSVSASGASVVDVVGVVVPSLVASPPLESATGASVHSVEVVGAGASVAVALALPVPDALSLNSSLLNESIAVSYAQQPQQEARSASATPVRS